MEVDVLSECLSFFLQSNILLKLKDNKDPQQSPVKVATVFCITSAKSSSCKLLLRYRYSGMRNCNLKIFS